MDTKFLSKNKFAIGLTILFIILLNYQGSFKFLLTTFIGRIILVLIILDISSYSIIFGVISILFFIIRFKQNNDIYLEGFKKKDDEVLKSFKEHLDIEKHKHNTTLNSSSAAASFEGFNTIDRESSILKGKNSKEIPVRKNSEQTKDFYVDPHYKITSNAPATFN